MQANPFLIQEYEPGQVILREGESNPCLYAVNQGKVEVVKGSGASETVLAVLGTGDIFGEMGLVDGQPASATVRAIEPTVVWLYDETAFKDTLASDPMLAKKVIDTLVARLRRTTELLQRLQASGEVPEHRVTEILDHHRMV